MIFDNPQPEHAVRAAHGIHSLPDEVSTFRLKDGKSRIVQRINDKQFRPLSLFSKFHASAPPTQMPIKGKPAMEPHSGVEFGDSRSLPYPAFSSPLEDIPFNRVYPSESRSEGDQSDMTKLESLCKLHDTHVQRTALFIEWESDYVLRPPSSPDVNAKRKWFR